jgi:DNA mismatch endonuclease (patch repair protein)
VADVYDKAKRSRIMASIKGKNTSPERILAFILKRLGFKPKYHYRSLPGSPDIVLPKKKVVIFVNGCFWHGHKNCQRAMLPITNRRFWREKISGNKRRDERQKKMLRRRGWKVLTFWTCKRITEQIVRSKLKLMLKSNKHPA